MSVLSANITWTALTATFHAYDDHEFINNFSGAGNDSTPPYPSASDAFRIYNANGNPAPPPSTKTLDHIPHYYDFRYGDVSFFVMDTRRYRSSPSDPPVTKTMLGEDQLSRLLNWLGKVSVLRLRLVRVRYILIDVSLLTGKHHGHVQVYRFVCSLHLTLGPWCAIWLLGWICERKEHAFGCYAQCSECMYTEQWIPYRLTPLTLTRSLCWAGTVMSLHLSSSLPQLDHNTQSPNFPQGLRSFLNMNLY